MSEQELMERIAAMVSDFGDERRELLLQLDIAHKEIRKLEAEKSLLRKDNVEYRKHFMKTGSWPGDEDLEKL
jgi:hypothetical protein